MTRAVVYVCPSNGELIRNCPTCRRTHTHARSEEVRKGDPIPTCTVHNVDLVPEPTRRSNVG